MSFGHEGVCMHVPTCVHTYVVLPRLMEVCCFEPRLETNFGYGLIHVEVESRY